MSEAATTFKCRGCKAEATFPDDSTVNGEWVTAARQAVRAMWCIGNYGRLCPRCWEPFHDKPERSTGPTSCRSDGEISANEPGKIQQVGIEGSTRIYFTCLCGACKDCHLVINTASYDLARAEAVQQRHWSFWMGHGWVCPACHVFLRSIS